MRGRQGGNVHTAVSGTQTVEEMEMQLQGVAVMCWALSGSRADAVAAISPHMRRESQPTGTLDDAAVQATCPSPLPLSPPTHPPVQSGRSAYPPAPIVHKSQLRRRCIPPPACPPVHRVARRWCISCP